VNLGDGLEAKRRRSHGHPGNGGLGQGCIPNPPRPEALDEPVGGAEDAAVDADIFAHDEHAIVFRHRVLKCHSNSLDQSELRHRSASTRSRRILFAPEGRRGSGRR
jgi:hypothetical protein